MIINENIANRRKFLLRQIEYAKADYELSFTLIHYKEINLELLSKFKEAVENLAFFDSIYVEPSLDGLDE